MNDSDGSISGTSSVGLWERSVRWVHFQQNIRQTVGQVSQMGPFPAKSIGPSERSVHFQHFIRRTVGKVTVRWVHFQQNIHQTVGQVSQMGPFPGLSRNICMTFGYDDRTLIVMERLMVRSSYF
jgi:hypothetical protein